MCFELSFGGELRDNNRWVVLAELLPWDEVESKYASCFREGNGGPALPVRVALGALLIKERLHISDEEMVGQIQEDHYLQYPEQVCAEKIFRTRENLEFCATKGIRLSGPKLGRPSKDDGKRREQRRIEREDEATRVAIEGKFGEGKRSYGLDCIATKLKETSETTIYMAFLMMNLMKMARDRMRSFFVFVGKSLISLSALLDAILDSQPLDWLS